MKFFWALISGLLAVIFLYWTALCVGYYFGYSEMPVFDNLWIFLLCLNSFMGRVDRVILELESR